MIAPLTWGVIGPQVKATRINELDEGTWERNREDNGGYHKGGRVEFS
jgi:hypothetical protein